MSFGGKSLTKADIERRRAIHEGGCMACEQRGISMDGSGYVQWHHTDGRKRHDRTCGLCQWHHMGRPMYGMTIKECRETFGPSLFHESKAFHDEFGSNAELLERQNRILRAQGIEVEGVECVEQVT